MKRLDITNNGVETGRSRTRNYHLQAPQCVPEGLASFANWAQMWMLGLSNQREAFVAES